MNNWLKILMVINMIGLLYIAWIGIGCLVLIPKIPIKLKIPYYKSHPITYLRSVYELTTWPKVYYDIKKYLREYNEQLAENL